MMPQPKPATRKFVIASLLVVALVAVIILFSAQGGTKNVARVAHADPELQAASKKAQDGLPNFIKELQSPKPGEGFAVKGAFKTSAGPEYLWVRSPEYKDGTFTGTLDQQPIAIADKKKGDTVKVAKKDVYDWLIKTDDGIQGMFTEKVLQQRSRG